MAIAYRNGTTAGSGDGSSLAVSVPAGVIDSDILIAVLYREGSSWTVPGTWNQIGSDVRAYANGNVWITVLWRRASSEPSSYTFNLGASTWRTGLMLAFSGAIGSGSPIGAYMPLVATGGIDTTVKAASITTSAAESMLVACMANVNGNAITVGSSGYARGPNLGGVEAWYAIQASAGASGVKTFNDVGTVNWVSMHLEILAPDLNQSSGQFSNQLDSLSLNGQAYVPWGAQARYQGYWTTPFAADQEVFATLSTAGPFQLWGRLVNPTQGGRTLRGYYVASDGQRVSLYRHASNVDVELGSWAGALSAGDRLHLRLESSGLKVNRYTSGAWTELISVTDPSPAIEAGYIGLGVYTGEARLDDFGGGSLSVASGSTGSLSVVLSGLSLVASSGTGLHGQVSGSLANLSHTLSAQIRLSGAATVSLDSLSLTTSSSSAGNATFNQTLGGLGFTAAGTVQSLPHAIIGWIELQVPEATNTRSGLLQATFGALGLVSAGSHPVIGAATPTLEAISASISGVVGSLPAIGTLTAALTDLTLISAGAHPLSGSATQILAALTPVAAGQIRVSGTRTGTLGTLGLSANGAVGNIPRVGSLSVSLAGLTRSAAGSTVLHGQAGITFAGVTLATTGTYPVRGSASASLGGMSLSGTGLIAATGPRAQVAWIELETVEQVKIGRFGTLARTLAGVSQTASGAARISGPAVALLDNLTLIGTGTRPSLPAAPVASSSQMYSSSTGSVVINRPAGVANGDVLVAQVACRGAGNSASAPSGWSLSRTDTAIIDAGDSLTSRLFYHAIGDLTMEPASYTFPLAIAARAGGQIIAVRNVDNAVVVNAASGQTATSASVSAPSFTTTRDGCLLLFFSAAANGSVSITPPSGMSEILDIANASVPGVHIGSAQALQAVKGATGSRTATLSGTAANTGQLVALSGTVAAADPSASVPLAHWYINPSNATAATIGADRLSLVVLDHNSTRLTFLNDLRANGFQGKALHYVVFDYTQAPNASYYPRASFWNYDANDWTEINSHEDWFLHSGTPATLSNRVPGTNTGEWYMDPGSAGWTAWVVARALAMIALGLWTFDGFFLDNTHLNWDKPYWASGNHLYTGTGSLIASSSAYSTRVLAHLSALKNAIGNVLLWGNTIQGTRTIGELDGVLQHLDGWMEEGAIGWWTGSTWNYTDQNAILTNMERGLALDKGFIFSADDATPDTQRMRYSLATYLLVMPSGAGPTSTPPTAYRFTQQDYNIWLEYPDYTHNLGNPLGPRYARTDGVSGWRRDFQYGYVQTNVPSGIGEITVTGAISHTGSLNSTLAGVGHVSGARVSVSGTSGTTLAGVSLGALGGTSTLPSAGQLSLTLENVSFSGLGIRTAGPVRVGTFAVSLAGLGRSALGVTGTSIGGDLTLMEAYLNGQGRVSVSGVGAPDLDGLMLTAGSTSPGLLFADIKIVRSLLVQSADLPSAIYLGTEIESQIQTAVAVRVTGKVEL